MNPQQLLIIVLAGILAAGAGTMVGARVQPAPAIHAVQSAPSSNSRVDRRKRFPGSDAERDVRGGQEMKPRW